LHTADKKTIGFLAAVDLEETAFLVRNERTRKDGSVVVPSSPLWWPIRMIMPAVIRSERRWIRGSSSSSTSKIRSRACRARVLALRNQHCFRRRKFSRSLSLPQGGSRVERVEWQTPQNCSLSLHGLSLDKYPESKRVMFFGGKARARRNTREPSPPPLGRARHPPARIVIFLDITVCIKVQ